ncbi:unnamed protein product, partial [Porites lobata]
FRDEIFLASNESIKRHLYEGDLLLTAHEYKVLKTRTQGHKRGFTLGRRWPDGPDGPMIPFQLDSDLGKSSKAGDAIEGAMKEWEKKSCVKFVPRSNQRVYITFIQDKRDRCASTNVGYTGRPYSVLLAPRCWWHGMILHELGHVIGYLHEHTRPDRDRYVTVKWENIKKGRGRDFQRQNNSDPSSYATPYDFSSIMHYGDGFASKNDKTLVPKKSGVTIGHWDSLSDIDIQQINLHYNCPADSYIFEKFICQDEKDKIECYGGRKIKITLAYYGRTKVFKCGLGFSTNCKAKGSEDKIKRACDGKVSCELHASNDVYGNPCPVWSSKYIEVKYMCSP